MYNVNSHKMSYYIPLFFCVLAISLSISAIFSRIPIFSAEVLSWSVCSEHGVAAIHFVVCCKRNSWVNMYKYNIFHALNIYCFSRTKETLCVVSLFLLQRQKRFFTTDLSASQSSAWDSHNSTYFRNGGALAVSNQLVLTDFCNAAFSCLIHPITLPLGTWKM